MINKNNYFLFYISTNDDGYFNLFDKFMFAFRIKDKMLINKIILWFIVITSSFMSLSINVSLLF